jgi:hypothetical protein
MSEDRTERPLVGSVPVRKACFRSLIAEIEVGDHQIRIKGSKDLLEKAVLLLTQLNHFPGRESFKAGVPARKEFRSQPPT